MKRYFTSDLHFGHENIIKYCNRPFANAAEMDAALISNWNKTVDKDDEVYILGDVFFCKADRAHKILDQLNGRLVLLLGNHDETIANQPSLKKRFRILPELHFERYDDRHIHMCHYPMLSWNISFHGSYMLHGHVHNSRAVDNENRRYDVGVDANGYLPVEWAHIKSTLDRIPTPKQQAASRGYGR